MSATMSRQGGSTETATPTTGWYADPLRIHDERYWDGDEWTGDTRDRPVPVWRWVVRVLLVASGVVAITLSLLSLSESREKLALTAVFIAIPLVIATSVQTVLRHVGHSRLTPLALVGMAWIVIVAVVTIASYRGFASYTRLTCLDRIAPSAGLTGCNLAGADLSGYDLQNADLTGADLHNAKLDNVSLGGADLSGANLQGASIVGSFLSNANLQYARLDGARLDASTFDKADLSNASLHRVNGIGTILTAAKLVHADIVDSDLSKAQLGGADLHGAVVQNTSLAEASFDKADLGDATLSSVKLDGAHLEGVHNVTDAQLASALGVDELDVAKRLSDGNLFLEPEASTSATVSTVCAGTPVEGAGTSHTNGAFVVIVNNDLTYTPGPNHVPALRYLDAVACVGPTLSDDIEQCGPYFYNDGSAAHEITRFKETVDVTLVDPATANVLAEQTFASPDPPPCAPTASDSTFTLGTPLDPAAIQAGINDLIATAGL
jgi:uncharacterized protein YjbI with pentapeptide repeats